MNNLGILSTHITANIDRLWNCIWIYLKLLLLLC